MAMTLAVALAHLDANDRPAALAALCDGWRAVRDPRVADAIDALAATVPSARPTGKTAEAKQAAWLAAAKHPTAAALGGLVATVTDNRKAEPLRERIWGLSKLPHDPRFAAAMVAMFRDPPILGGTFRLPFRAACEVIVAVADARQLAAIDQLAADLVDADKAGGRVLVAEGLPELRAKLAAAVAKQRVELAADDVAILARISAELAATAQPAGSTDELFAAVYAAPEDDGARLVLADELQRRGDPRGEFIALQLARGRTGKASKRERELLAAAGRDWLGALEPVIAKTGVGFERGFLATCALRDNDDHVYTALVDRPEWRLLEHVDVASASRRTIPVARMCSARSLANVYAGELGEHPFLESIELSSAGSVADLARRDWPALRHVSVRERGAMIAFDDLSALWTSPLGRQLESFSISVFDLATWFPRVFELPMPRVQVGQGYNPWQIELGNGVATFRRRRTPSDIATFHGLASFLDRVPPDRVRRAIVELHAAEPLPDNIAAALARFDAHEVLY